MGALVWLGTNMSVRMNVRNYLVGMSLADCNECLESASLDEAMGRPGAGDRADYIAEWIRELEAENA